MGFVVRAAGVLLGLSIPMSAIAHAMLDRSEPKVGSSVRASPRRVEIWFTEPLEPAFSTMKVIDAAGREVDGGNAKVDSADAKHLSVPVPHLPTGRYRVVWRAISVDTHATEGDFTFEVTP